MKNGTVYLLTGYSKTYTENSCKARPNFSFMYPAAILFAPSTMAPMIADVENSQQALFWIGFYKAALDGSLQAAISNAKLNSNVIISHPDEGMLAAMSDEYKVLVTELRDLIDDGIYNIGIEDEATAEIFKDILSASLGSIPYLQEAKLGVELCAGEDIITAEPVTVGWDTLLYVIPGGKIAQKFEKYKNVNKVKELIGKPENVIQFAKQIFGSEARRTAQYLGKSGERAVSVFYDIGKKPTKPIDMFGSWRIPDGLTNKTLSEVKNVARQSLTKQIKDDIKFAESQIPPLIFNLYVRDDTVLSGPLIKEFENKTNRNIIKIRMP